jgi:hypothetical protein
VKNTIILTNLVLIIDSPPQSKLSIRKMSLCKILPTQMALTPVLPPPFNWIACFCRHKKSPHQEGVTSQCGLSGAWAQVSKVSDRMSCFDGLVKNPFFLMSFQQRPGIGCLFLAAKKPEPCRKSTHTARAFRFRKRSAKYP